MEALELTKTKIICHNKQYVQQIIETYPYHQAAVLLNKIACLALMRTKPNAAITITSTEEDFLLAFRLFRIQQLQL